jgi:hypothetical protein
MLTRMCEYSEQYLLGKVPRQVINASPSHCRMANPFTARINSNFGFQRLSDETMEAHNSLAIPDGKGRSVDFSKPFGIPRFQNSTV